MGRGRSIHIRGLLNLTSVLLMNKVALVVFLWTLLTFNVEAQESTQQRVKIGVPTALSGASSAWGNDIKNALTLMNERSGNRRYDLIFEDERCDNRTAVTVAHKLINIDKIKYALGFPCNSTLLATASIYSKSNVVVITSSATSGDVLNIGNSIFQLFPSDVLAADLLFTYIARTHRKIAILTEQNEYPVMMERSIRRANEKAGAPLKIVSEEFVHGQTDLTGW